MCAVILATPEFETVEERERVKGRTLKGPRHA
jgi:hypothetical protein